MSEFLETISKHPWAFLALCFVPTFCILLILNKLYTMFQEIYESDSPNEEKEEDD